MPRTRKSKKGGVAAPPQEEVYFEVLLADLNAPDFDPLNPPYSPEHVLENANAIVEWYNEAVDDHLEQGILTSMRVSHARDNIFRGKYTTDPNASEDKIQGALKMFANDDEDGNNPIEIAGSEFLVKGNIVDKPVGLDEEMEGGRRRRRRKTRKQTKPLR